MLKLKPSKIELSFDGQKISFRSEQDLEAYIEQTFDSISRKAQVKWMVCTNSNISLKNEPKSVNDRFSFNRQGMIKWGLPEQYLVQAAEFSDPTQELLISLLKNTSSSEDDWDWWQKNKIHTPTNLGWYIDLAIKTWQYRRSR